MESATQTRPVEISCDGISLQGDLAVPAGSGGIVLFAHGSGSSRMSIRNRFVADAIQHAGLGTLLLDLLTDAEEAEDDVSGTLRFDIGLLGDRLVRATRWVREHEQTRDLAVGYFGSSTGAAAALVAAAELGPEIRAVVSRGGRPDLALDRLSMVVAPTLLVVGEQDQLILRLNVQAAAELKCRKELIVVPKAGHLFEEPGALGEVARHASAWFGKYLGPA